uniref:Uncharacterized protein n=1 Tax=Mus musculus TaxID=10090 RepID=Q8C992_MOUSE|nr:unnamed protein product [Mus musculus]
MTTSCRLRRRSTAARSAARRAFSPAESPYTVGSCAPSTEASSTTYTARPSLASARRSSSVRWLLPLDGSPQTTTSGMISRGIHVRMFGVNFRQEPEEKTELPVPLHSYGTFCFYGKPEL